MSHIGPFPTHLQTVLTAPLNVLIDANSGIGTFLSTSDDAGLQPHIGDISILIINTSNDATFNFFGKSWTLLGKINNGTGLWTSIYYRVVTADHESYGVGISPSCEYVQFLYCYRNVGYLDQFSLQATASSTSHSTASVTCIENQEVLLVFFALLPSSASAWTLPGDFTKDRDIFEATIDACSGHKVQSVAGPTGVITATYTYAGVGTAAILTLSGIGGQ